MEFHALDRRGVGHVMTTHRGQDDETPLQLISVQQLARFQALESGLRALLALFDQGPPAADSPGPAGSSDCSTPPT